MTNTITTHVRQVPATATKYWTLDDIKAANRAGGGHWFSRDTMRFFRSRVGSTVYQGPGGIYFVSSEQHTTFEGPLLPRKYTVRKFEPLTGDVNTVGDFNVLTRARAIYFARFMANPKGGR